RVDRGGDVRVAEPSSGKPRLDLLEQPAVAVRIAERGERAIAGMVGCGPADPTARAVTLELSPRRPGVEHLADHRTTDDELVACSLDVGDDEVKALGRARRGRRDVRAELDRTPRAGRRELDYPEAIIESEIGVQPPPQAPVEALGAIDIGHRNDDDLELQIDRRSSRRVCAAFIARLCNAHCDLRNLVVSGIRIAPRFAAQPSRRAGPGLPQAPG